MIKFFRKIRQNLVSEGKTGKYLKYAIGEIVLVVIGILIALQINNWNEQRKNHSFEKKILSEINNAITQDLIHFEWMITRMEKVDSASKVMAQHIINKSIFVDSMYLQKRNRYYGLTMATTFQYNSGPYETIKSSGLDKISNDSLRTKITNLYDFILPRTEKLIAWHEKDYEEQTDKLISFLGDIEVNYHDDHIDFISKFPEDLFQNQEFIKLIKDINKRAIIVKSQYKKAIQDIESVHKIIDDELKK